MEKTLTIDGKKVRFKSTAATPLRYKAQFGTDFFTDLIKMYPIMKANKKNPSYEVLQSLDLDVFYNILWALAKTADKEIPEPMEWLDEFEEFPLFDIFKEVQDLLLRNMQTTKKK